MHCMVLGGLAALFGIVETKVSTSGTGFMIGNSIMYYLITVHDTFDFAYDNNYDDLFTTTVNNWAWLCQQTHVLNPIEINLSTAIG